MTLTEKLKLKTAVKLFGSTAAGVGYKLAKSGAQELTEEMQNELEDAMLPLVLQYNELLQSRDEYQKAADAMAAEHKIEREQLQAENERLKDLELTWRICNERSSEAAQDLSNELQSLRESKSKPAIKIAEVIDDFCKQPHNTQYVKVFESGVRFAEKYHGVGGEK